MLRKFIAALAIFLTVSAASAGFGIFQVNGTNAVLFTTAGQSNDVGDTNQSDLPVHLQTPDPMVKVWTASGWATLQNGVNGSNLTLPSADFPANPPQNWGPEAEFIYQYRLAHPNTTVYLVKYSYGGIPLCSCINDGQGQPNNWDPATVNNYFQSMQDVIAAARAALPANVPHEGMLWMQGEQDAQYTIAATAYQTNLAAFLSAVQSRWAAPRRVMIGRITTTFVESAAVRTAQVANSSLPNVPWINTDSFPLQPDNIHYNATGQVDLGGAMYTAWATGTNQ